MPCSHYEVMGADRSASHEELKARWRALSRELHPDRFSGFRQSIVDHAAAQFAEVSAAWAVLQDRKKRAAYDAGLDVTTDQCGECRGKGRLWSGPLASRTHRICGRCHGNGRVERRKT